MPHGESNQNVGRAEFSCSSPEESGEHKSAEVETDS